MVKLVFLHKAGSIYDHEPDRVYDFPRSYLLLRPDDPRNAPHPGNLQWHRENVLGQVPADDPAPWE